MTKMWVSKLPLLLPILLLLHPSALAASSTLDEGIELFHANEIEQATAAFEAVCESEPDNTVARLWLADCLGRSGRQAQAVALARGVLEVDPGSAFAHTEIGRVNCPWLEPWGGSSEDSAWVHLNRAVALDSTEVDALELLWVLAIKRNEPGIMTSALEAMGRSGLHTPACLEYTRWVLDCIQPNAILVTNGDMDTYPSLALQVHSSLRPDLAIVNASLLNTRWYARFVSDEYGLPVPDSILQADSLMILVLEGSLPRNGLPEGSPAGALEAVGLSPRILRYWVGLDRDGQLGRPIAFAVTTSTELRDCVLPHAVLSGPAWYPADSTGHCITGIGSTPPEMSRSIDIEATRQALSGLDTGLLIGDMFVGNDRNPYTQFTGRGLLMNLAELALLVPMNPTSIGDILGVAGDMAVALGIAQELGLADDMAGCIPRPEER
jgi:hypothetical protein